MPNYHNLPDPDLIAKCREQDAVAWETLVRRYQRLIASVTFKFGLDADDAADVFQAVCLALFQQLHNLKEQTRLGSWLITVTVRECWKLRKRGAKTTSLAAAFGNPENDEQIEIPDPAHQPADEQMLALERQHLIRRAVSSLSSQCRQLLEQLFYRDQPPSYAEIGRALSMPIASIGPTRGRCLTKLKEALRKMGFDQSAMYFFGVFSPLIL
jgi:RNA polymerase sigma factor (sigma-70 family)